MKHKRVILWLAVTAAILLLLYRPPWLPYPRVGDVRINPRLSPHPQRVYNITVWESDLPLPGGTTSYGDALQEALTTFEAEHHNIKTHLILRPHTTDDTALRDAIENGVAPDVVGFQQVRWLSKEYQIPLEHYLTLAQADDLLPKARQGATLRHLWAIPSLILPARWLIKNEEGDPWPSDVPNLSQWTQMMIDLKTDSHSPRLALNIIDPAFFYELMVSATGLGLLDSTGEVQWQEEALRQVTQQLISWRQQGFIPANLHDAAKTRLTQFWTADAIALAPTTPWLMHHVFERVGLLDAPTPNESVGTGQSLEQTSGGIHWMPPPQIGQTLHIHATVSGYSVFRQANYKGDDHTAAAVLVATHLAQTMGTWTATRLFGVPAHKSAAPTWRSQSLLPIHILTPLQEWCDHTVFSAIDDHLLRQEQNLMKDCLLPHLMDVLAGQLSLENFLEICQKINANSYWPDLSNSKSPSGLWMGVRQR